MPYSTAPCLRPDVAVRPFDAVEGDRRFLVAVDDRHFLVSAAVAAVLESTRQPGTLALVAERASARLGVRLSPQQVATFLGEQAPAVLFQADAQQSTSRSPLRFQRRIISGDRLRPLLVCLARLFEARTAGALVLAFLIANALVAWRALGTPFIALARLEIGVALALTLAGVFIHELGHLAACVRHGAPHGGVGAGLYWCFPAFYSEVHGAWQLNRRQRATVDAGGLYLQGAFVLLLCVSYAAFPSPALLSAIAWSHVLMLHTLNPVLKFDGYWLMTDLTGTPNLHRTVRHIARRAWQAVWSHVRRPSNRELALLAAFFTAAIVYFTYLLVMLGQSVASAAFNAVSAWAQPTTLSATALMHVLTSTALLGLLLAMSLGVAVLLARSIKSVVQGDDDDH
jgi:putative peptide zinc metalloprotease protein